MRIELGGLAMSDGTPDANGCLWYVDSMEGWDSASVAQSLGSITGRHGSVVLENKYESRTIVLGGVMKAPNEAAFWDAYYLATGGLVGIFTAKNLIVEETVPKTIEVIQGAAPRIEFIGVGAFKFELTLVAPNPLKYETTSELHSIAAGATATITVGGTFFAYPTITTGGAVNVQSTTTGLILQTATNVPSGTVFDTWNRTVYNGSTNLYGNLADTSDWPVYMPGANIIKNLGSQSVTLAHTNTYV